MELINRVVNFRNIKELGLTSTKALLFFYLAISGNYINNLYSKQLQYFLDNNKIAQHVAGFLTLYSLITGTIGIGNSLHAFYYTLFCFIWFILTTKLDLKWNLIVIAALFIGTAYENKMSSKETSVEEDESLEESDKKKIKKKNKLTHKVILGTILVITIIGVYNYYAKKRIQYGGNFDMMEFAFGGLN